MGGVIACFYDEIEAEGGIDDLGNRDIRRKKTLRYVGGHWFWSQDESLAWLRVWIVRPLYGNRGPSW